ncbi:aminodeoxychorismate lyase [Chitinilyticum litopenaei]|uniref:aminodeoxychorismate lyase n=1 Tax=Chitinilyticum litopenaei TaxID=1121276 RepID=UPI000408B3E1|nr:aminodeoxychorismate lyase [Chitinilyticum litopenaei]
MKLINGQPAEALSLADRAIQFGDGVFRTLKVEAGGVAFWARHYAKLRADCAALAIVCPDEATLLDDLRRLGVRDATVKIIITRGESARGYAVPAACTPNRIVQAAPLPQYPAAHFEHGVTLRVCETRASWQPALAGVKHLNRLENVLARQEWQDPAIFDGLLLDRDGMVVEGVISNVFALQGRRVLTPTLVNSGVAGVMRGILLELFSSMGYEAIPSDMTLEELARSEQLWLSNSLFGLLPVASLQHWRWQPHPLGAVVREALTALAQRETLQLV